MADSQIHVALAGNPNCGKTTLFNLITGANGYVGNWPGVTVEKKEAKLLSDKNVTITDLPGIYSLSPYSPEEQCSRDYLMSGEPDVVVQVVDATNLERNLYLALQVIETGLPVVVALNMADLVEKNGDKIDTDKLSKKLGCPVMMISALKNKGIKELFEQVKKSAASKGQVPEHKFDSSIEDVLDHIENNLPASVPANKRRYYAVKLFERDADACKLINLTKEKAARVEELVAQCEQDCDDDAESIITGERYGVIAHIIDECLTKAPAKMSTSEKIDRVVTNRILGLPIFVVIMFCVYYIAVSTLGGTVTDFTNDQLFGTDGWYVLGQGRDAYDAAVEAAGDDADSVDPAQYGPYVPGITTMVHDALVAGGTEDGGLVDSLVCDGIVGGLGAIFGFVPQMFLLFVMLSFLEDCGYMARVAFIMDRVFRRFGLSGKSFIPHARVLGLRRPRRHGYQDHREREGPPHDGHDHHVHSLWRQAADYCPAHGFHHRRFFHHRRVDQPALLLLGRLCRHRLGPHAQEDQALRRSPDAVRYGASRLPLPGDPLLGAACVGALLGLYQEGRHGHLCLHCRRLVPVQLW